jgi:hypothetical protein
MKTKKTKSTTTPPVVSKRKPLGLTKDDLPECLHVALRKGCDSTPTSILWNLIYIMEPGMWSMYLDHVWSKLKIAEATGQEYWEALKEVSLGFEHEVYRNREPKLEGHSLTLMDITFHDFDDNDWKGYACYIEEY